ncbi:OLC1v1030584C1 [Oldenlandia corymbosa var. corymbosa]|uniref:OLC1v1030584C1 n=1 Tax=Oldenlandia corymbosa var. corymbosa TaxID=529605 RepID=A0AAV1CHA0_OLDCO|nr:OLC1v1030584C1 [Oldenlandia corymbosa var. corymbosa]
MAPELVSPKDVVPSSSVVEDFSRPESQTKKVDDGNIKSVSDPSSISVATKTVNHQVPIVNSGVPMNSHFDSGNESVESEATVNLKAIVDRAPSVPNVAAQRYIADINGMIDTKSIYFSIVVRVMTLWKGNKIQATIHGRYVKDFVDFFREGCVRKLSRFDHALNISGGFRCAQHEYKILFESKTLVESVIDLDIDIPFHVFEFMPFAEVTNFIANFDYCFDLIGHLIAYSDPIVDYGKKRIFVELEDERADRLKVTLWGEHVDRVIDYMCTNPSYPVVLIVQYVKCKKYYCK